MNEQPTLETDRLALRRCIPSDATEVQSKAGDYRVAKMTENIPHPYLDGMAEEWINTHTGNWIRRERATWAICLKGARELVGCVALTLNMKHYRASLGYWIGHEHWGQGYCTEAAVAVVNYGFEAFKLQRIEALHLTINPASGAVMRKIGMKHEGTMCRYVLKEGIHEDMEYYAIFATEN